MSYLKLHTHKQIGNVFNDIPTTPNSLLIVPVPQLAPLHPGKHVQWPEIGSHWAPFWQVQVCEQSWPCVPEAQATHGTHKTTIYEWLQPYIHLFKGCCQVTRLNAAQDFAVLARLYAQQLDYGNPILSSVLCWADCQHALQSSRKLHHLLALVLPQLHAAI